MRRIDLAAPSTRPWNKEDDPLHPPTGPAKKTGESHFQLQTRPVAFSVTGASNEVMALLKSIDADPRWKHANSVELRPVNNNSRELQLDLSLWYFALVRNGEST